MNKYLHNVASVGFFIYIKMDFTVGGCENLNSAGLDRMQCQVFVNRV